MYTPVILSGALFISGVAGAVSRRAARTILPVVSAITLADCLIGFGFHIRGIQRKPGGWRLPVFNIVMGPPIFAPLLFGTSAYLGLVASFLRREDSSQRVSRHPAPVWSKLLPRKLDQHELTVVQELREGRFQRHLAVATAAAAFFSGIEALYSHYKNNFKYKAQWSPIVIAAALVGAAMGAVRSPRVAKKLLPAVSVLAIADGAVGFYYHARGVVAPPRRLETPCLQRHVWSAHLCSSSFCGMRVSRTAGQHVSEGTLMPSGERDGRPVNPKTGERLPQRAQPGYYPGFSTLSQRSFWDEATRKLILARVEIVPPIRFFSPGRSRADDCGLQSDSPSG